MYIVLKVTINILYDSTLFKRMTSKKKNIFIITIIANLITIHRSFLFVIDVVQLLKYSMKVTELTITRY